MKIGIIVAMDSELESIKSILSDYGMFSFCGRTSLFGNYNNHKLYVCKGGIGKANAAATAAILKSYDPDIQLIISTGCAGGITSDLKIGDIVVGGDYCYHDVWCPINGDERRGQLQDVPFKLKWRSEIIDLCDATKWISDYHVAHVYTGDQFIQDQETVNKILSCFPEDDDGLSGICDMESMAIAQICYQNNISFISFRVISDLPCNHSDAEYQLLEYNNFWNSASDALHLFLKSFLDSIREGR